MKRSTEAVYQVALEAIDAQIAQLREDREQIARAIAAYISTHQSEHDWSLKPDTDTSFSASEQLSMRLRDDGHLSSTILEELADEVYGTVADYVYPPGSIG